MKDLTNALRYNGTGSFDTRIKVFGQSLANLASDRPEILCLSGDLTRQCEADFFQQAHPDRFYSMGMAEQNMVGVAAGLARSGEIPFVHSFATFLTRRCYDQIVNAVAVPNLPVRLAGFMPGLSSPGGPSHQSTDDLALMRATPNMTVLDLGEATEMAQAVALAADVDGPVYLRVRRNELPVIFDESTFQLALGESYLLRTGGDVGLICSGMMTERALQAAVLLEQQGVSAAVLHMPSIKPLDADGIKHLAATTRLLVSLDNHNVIGGLGSAAAEVLSEEGGAPPLLRLGLHESYAWCGSRPYLFRLFGLDPDQIAAVALARLNGAPLPTPAADNVKASRTNRGWGDDLQ